MLLLSTGLTCGTFCSNDWMLMSGTRMTVPVTCAGSRLAMSFSMAMIETYSVPCAPETSARTLPGLAPLTMTTGMLVAASTPAGTPRVPVDFSPGAAEAVPTRKAWANSGAGRKSKTEKTPRQRREFIKTPWDCNLTDLNSTVTSLRRMGNLHRFEDRGKHQDHNLVESPEKAHHEYTAGGQSRKWLYTNNCAVKSICLVNEKLFAARAAPFLVIVIDISGEKDSEENEGNSPGDQTVIHGSWPPRNSSGDISHRSERVRERLGAAERRSNAAPLQGTKGQRLLVRGFGCGSCWLGRTRRRGVASDVVGVPGEVTLKTVLYMGGHGKAMEFARVDNELGGAAEAL